MELGAEAEAEAEAEGEAEAEAEAEAEQRSLTRRLRQMLRFTSLQRVSLVVRSIGRPDLECPSLRAWLGARPQTARIPLSEVRCVPRWREIVGPRQRPPAAAPAPDETRGHSLSTDHRLSGSRVPTI